MLDIKFSPTNQSEILAAFRMAPQVTRDEVNKALRLSLGEISKKQTDRYFQFKSPRSARTGMFQRTMITHTALRMKELAATNGLEARTRSPVFYSDYVVEDNDIYGRILEASEGQINKHMDRAVDNVIQKITI